MTISKSGYKLPLVERALATSETAMLLRSYFDAKNRQSVPDTMAFFSPELTAYTDATLGWKVNGFAEEQAIYERYMSHWGEGRSYPVRIIGGPDSSVVFMTDTPELFGGEIHAIAVVDILDGKIVRWVDYWDSAGFPDNVYNALAKFGTEFPADFGDRPSKVDPRLQSVCETLHNSMAEEKDVSSLFVYDAAYLDMGLRTSLIGSAAIGRYVKRLAGHAPFAEGSKIRHIAGGAKGGAYEWVAGSKHAGLPGVTVVELNSEGLITNLTAAYDTRRINLELRSFLLSLSSDW